MSGWRGGPGFADKDGHPLCYMSLRSEVILPSRRQRQDQRPWLSDRFPQLSEVNTSMSSLVASSAYERVLLPTNRVYYTGLNSPGACRLEKVSYFVSREPFSAHTYSNVSAGLEWVPRRSLVQGSGTSRRAEENGDGIHRPRSGKRNQFSPRPFLRRTGRSRGRQETLAHKYEKY